MKTIAGSAKSSFGDTETDSGWHCFDELSMIIKQKNKKKKKNRERAELN